MVSIDDNCHVVSAKYVAEFLRYLHGQALLDLRALCEVLHDAVQFRQTNHGTVGNVSHMRFSNDGHEVVLAVGVESDVLFHQHFVVLVLVIEHGHFRFILRIESAENLLHIHFSNPFRGATQAVIGQVKTHGKHDFPEVMLNFRHLFLIREVERIRAQWCLKRSHDVVITYVVVGQKEVIAEIAF